MKPSSMPMKAIEKIGFDPSAKRRRPFSQFIKALPTPTLGKGRTDDSGSIELEIINEY